MRRRNASTGKQLCSNMEGLVDMRVKLEYQGEKRILPVARPVMIEQLQAKIRSTFGDGLSINYENGEVFIPIMKQTDLDKAIALLDQNPHLTSLRLTLTPKTLVASDVNSPHDSSNANGTQLEFFPDLDSNMEDNYSKDSFDDEKCFCGKNGDITRPVPIRDVITKRSHSNPEEMCTSLQDELMSPIRSFSMYIPAQHNSQYGHSPPPGHLPEAPGLLHNYHHEVKNGGGVFIPEDTNDVLDTKHSFNHLDFRPEASFGFDPLSPKERDWLHDDVDPLLQPRRTQKQKLKESFDSLLGSSSPLSTSHMSIASEDNSFYRQTARRGERRRPLSDLIPDTFTSFEYDSDGTTSLKSDPYLKSKGRPHSEWNLTYDSFDSGGSFSWMNSYRERFIPVHRTASSSSIGQSSNSSGLVPDFDSRGERDILDRVHKLQVNGDSSIRWKQLRLLGAGAFGTVYLCVDLDTGKEMAMKCVETGLINPATIKEVEVLQREIQLYRTIKHERVVQYFGTAQDSKSISIFMEYMEGGSIHEKISKMGAFSEEEVSKYCRQILEGIAYLHNKNIIHRDIKGANILLDGNDNCKLADFGASRQIQTIRSKTGCKSVHGTPYWMSPEVINGEGYGRKADIWSLGCTALEMLTTKPPWFQFEPMAALFKIATQPTHPNLPIATSASCRQFVEICFNRDTSVRPTAIDLLHYHFVNR